MRMHIKNNRKTYKNRKIKLLIVFFLLFIFLFYIISRNLSDFYLEYSTKKAQIIMINSINNAVLDNNLDIMKKAQIYKINKNKEGEIISLDYNTYLVNKFLKEISTNVETTLKKEEEQNKNIYFSIPIGSVTKNPLFNDKGPKIPVKMEIIGSVISNIKTNIKEYGINNALIEMTVNIEVEEKIMLPITSNNIKITTEIPISYNIITGKIPNYYGGEILKNSSVYDGLLNKN